MDSSWMSSLGPFSYLTRALTVDRTTLDSRNSGVTRMWKRDREAKATEGEKSDSLKKLTWPTKVCRESTGGQGDPGYESISPPTPKAQGSGKEP